MNDQNLRSLAFYFVFIFLSYRDSDQTTHMCVVKFEYMNTMNRLDWGNAYFKIDHISQIFQNLANNNISETATDREKGQNFGITRVI